MIRTLFLGLAVVAIINMLAIGGLIGWLSATDRLDDIRIQDLRQLFTETIAERTAREQEELAAAELKEQESAELERQSQPPIPSADILTMRLENSQADLARLEATRREVEILQETLRRERRALEEDKTALARERHEFDRARSIIARTEGDAQFRKALATYEGLKPDAARAAFAQLIANGETDQVVAYLNAMQERGRTRIITEFLQDQPAVATDLLERLRQRGLAAPTPESNPG